MRPKLPPLIPTILLSALVSAPASAGDGVLEINQTCAVQTGCFAGDAAGFPVTIDGSAGRSYRLTSDLVVTSENTDAIVVGADDVSVDLNRFSLRGPVSCSGAPLTCTPATGSGSGVESTSLLLSGTSVRNGSIRGMGAYGVQLGVQAEVADLRMRSNRIAGIRVGSGSTISGSTAYQNGAEGIYTTVGATISGNTTQDTGSDGIFASDGSTIVSNTAYGNGGDGISTSSGCTVKGTTVRSNTGYGLDLGDQSGFRANVVTSNTAGTVNGNSLVDLGDNACNGAATCP